MDLLTSDDFRRHVEDLMHQRHVPGLAIAIVHNGEIRSHGFGYASVAAKEPCTADTLFDIASASKSVTAASVALLVEDDDKHPDVKWDAVVSKLLPGDFVLSDQALTDGITIDDILSHRTGMPSHDLSYMGPQAGPQADTSRSVTRNFRNLPAAAPLRSKFLYNNMMYTAATYLVEAHTGQEFADFAAERIFAPLGMASTHVQPARARAHGLDARIAKGHIWQDSANSYREFDTPDCPEAQGAGSIMTSANDYVRWVQALVEHAGPVVSEGVYASLIRIRMPCDPDGKDLSPFTSPDFYGAGLYSFYYRGHQVVAHSGGVPGFATVHFFLPAHGFGGVVFLNVSGGGDGLTFVLAYELIDAVLDVPRGDRVDWTAEFKPEADGKGKRADKRETLRQKLCPGIAAQDEPQTRPLKAYVGAYAHPGYGTLRVEEREGRLCVDATNRSMGFTFRFAHVCEQTKYIAALVDMLDGDGEDHMAEFAFEQASGGGEHAVRLGVDLDEDMEGMIWFERVPWFNGGMGMVQS